MVSIIQQATKRIVLVGGGHSHTHILRELQRNKLPDTRVTLISPNRYQYYSGMFSGYMEGNYGLEDIRIDLAHLCQQATVEFIMASVIRVDPQSQEVLTSRDERIRYDIISFNIGSGLSGMETPRLHERFDAFIKPNHNITQVKDTLLTKERIVVVGGGLSGIEISLSLQANRNRSNRDTPVTLLHSGQLMEDRESRASNRITTIVREKGVHLVPNDTVISVSDNHLITSLGSRIPFDGLLWLTGASAPPVFQESGLPTDRRGYLLVNDRLQSIAYPNMFGAGDCVGLQSHPKLHKAGVFAVREAPVLWFNLQRYGKGERLRAYRPLFTYLSILSTGDEEAFLLYGSLFFHGRWCWKVKRTIDMAFVRKYK
jgi:pyridine nucleotide-disulfide oxidoreductase family protein